MKIGIIGAGTWGTALAGLLGSKGFGVDIWAFEEDVVQGINREKKNPVYLPFFEIKGDVKASTDLEKIVREKDLIISVMPSTHVREIWEKAGKHLSKDAILLNCTKGIEIGTHMLMHEVLSDALPNHPKEKIIALSGPSFAQEVARQKTTLVTIAGLDEASTSKAQSILKTESFLIFLSKDIVGIEVGGAVKNVIAIACGIIDGMELGENARAALITRGLYEMIKIGQRLGANPLTFSGLSGIGDLVLTCTGGISRNHQLGAALGRGIDIQKFTTGTKMVAEGYATAKAIHELCQERQIKAPICHMIYRILYEGLSPSTALKELTSVELGEELRGIL